MLTGLAEGAATVGELRTPFAMSGPAVSRHLRVLETVWRVFTDPAELSRWLHPGGMTTPAESVRSPCAGAAPTATRSA